MYRAVTNPPARIDGTEWNTDNGGAVAYFDWTAKVAANLLEVGGQGGARDMFNLLHTNYVYSSKDLPLTNKLYLLLSQWITGGIGLRFLLQHRTPPAIHGGLPAGRGDLVWRAFTEHFHKKYRSAGIAAANRFLANPNCANLTTEVMFNSLYHATGQLEAHTIAALPTDFEFSVIELIWVTDHDAPPKTPNDIDRETRRQVANTIRTINETADAADRLKKRVDFNFAALSDFLTAASLDGGTDMPDSSAAYQVQPLDKTSTNPRHACWYYNNGKPCPHGDKCKFAHVTIPSENKQDIPVPRAASHRSLQPATQRSQQQAPTNAGKTPRTAPRKPIDTSSKSHKRTDKTSNGRSQAEACRKFSEGRCTKGKNDCPNGRRHTLNFIEQQAVMSSAKRLFDQQTQSGSILAIEAAPARVPRVAQPTIAPTEGADASAAPATAPRHSFHKFMGLSKSVMFCFFIACITFTGPAFSSDISGDGPLPTAPSYACSDSLLAQASADPDQGSGSGENWTIFDNVTNRFVTLVRRRDDRMTIHRPTTFDHVTNGFTTAIDGTDDRMIICDHEGREHYRSHRQLSTAVRMPRAPREPETVPSEDDERDIDHIILGAESECPIELTVADDPLNVTIIDIDKNSYTTPPDFDFIEQLYTSHYIGDERAENLDQTASSTTPHPDDQILRLSTEDARRTTDRRAADATIPTTKRINPPRHILADSGAGVTVCPDARLVHNRTPVDNITLGDAGTGSHGHSHLATFRGELHLLLNNDKDGSQFELRVPCLVVPSIGSTLLNTTHLWKELRWTAVTQAGIGTTWTNSDGRFSHTLETIGSQEYFRVSVILPKQTTTHSVMMAGDELIRAQMPTTSPTTSDTTTKRKAAANHDTSNAQRARHDQSTGRGGAAMPAQKDIRYDLGTSAYVNDPITSTPGDDHAHSDYDLIATTPGARDPLPVTPSFEAQFRITPVPEILVQLRDNKLNRNEADWVRCQLARQRIITTSGTNDRFLALHHRLGHINARDTLAVARKYNLDIGKFAGIACDACHKAKSKRQSVSTTPTPKSHYAPLGAWCLDFYGPTTTPATFGKSKYLLAAIDKCTRKGIIVPLANLGHEAVQQAIREFAAQVRQLVDHAHELNINIDMGPNIQTDSAPIFISKHTRSIFVKFNFTVFFATPGYTQAKNGMVERFLGVISASAKAMLYACGLPFGFFPEACIHATLIHNVTPHSSLGGLSPEEFLTGTAPNIDIIKPFGANVWIHQHVRENKEAPKGLPGFYLGMDRLSQSHLVFYRTPKTGRPIRLASYHVTFDQRLPVNVLNGSVPTIRDELSFDDPPPSSPELVCQLVEASTLRDDDEAADLFVAALDGTIYYNERGALNSPDGEYFKYSLREELDGLTEMGAIRAIDISELTDEEIQRATPCMTLFYMKRDSLGNLKAKCRLTFKGSNQVRDVDYILKSNHTPRWSTVRAHFSVQPRDPVGHILTQSDIKKFFCHCKNETPDGHRVIARLPIHARILKDGIRHEYIVLDKALYGQVNSGYLAEAMLWNFLRDSGWTQCYDPTTWRRGDTRILIWVDDIVSRGPPDQVHKFLEELDVRFPGITANPCTHFLGHDVSRDPITGMISISAETFIKDAIENHNITHTKDTPMTPGTQPAKIVGEPNPLITTTFRSIVGTLSFLANTVRPDLAYAASALGQCAANPNDGQLEAAKHALKYINGTATLGIQYAHMDDEHRNQFECYVDASYADAPGFRSQSGCIIMCNNAPISFFSRTQKLVTTSSQEAEIVAAADAAKEVFFLRELLESWHCDAWPTRQLAPTTCHEDNTGAISWLENGSLGDRTRHYGIRSFYLREQMGLKRIRWQYINTTCQLADALTKSLANKKLRFHLDKIMVEVYHRLVAKTLVVLSQKPAKFDDDTSGHNALMFTSRSW